LYDDIFSKALPIPDLPSGEDVILLARQPYVANQAEQNFDALLKIILDSYTFKKVFDSKLYKQSFIRYEDKLFQSFLFEQLKIPYAALWDISQPDTITYPLIAKKRLSSRHTANYVLYNSQDLEAFRIKFNSEQYIFQTFFPLKGDYRVLVCKGEILGVVARDAWLEEDNKTNVKVRETAELPAQILRQAIQVSEVVGCDLCGIDIGEKENGEFFFIEYNPSPQFLGFERVTKKNISKTIILSILQQAK